MAYIAGELIDADHPLAVSLSGGGSVLIGGDVVSADDPLTTLIADVSIATTDLRDASVASPNDADVMTFVAGDSQWQSKPIPTPAGIAAGGGSVAVDPATGAVTATAADGADATAGDADGAEGASVTLAPGMGGAGHGAGNPGNPGVVTLVGEIVVLPHEGPDWVRVRISPGAPVTIVLAGWGVSALSQTPSGQVGLVGGAGGDAGLGVSADGDVGIPVSSGKKLAFFADEGNGAVQQTLPAAGVVTADDIRALLIAYGLAVPA